MELDWSANQCAIIVVVTRTRFGSAMSGHLLGGLILFKIWVWLSTAAVRAENKKRFIAPIHQLEPLIEDQTFVMRTSVEADISDQL